MSLHSFRRVRKISHSDGCEIQRNSSNERHDKITPLQIAKNFVKTRFQFHHFSSLLLNGRCLRRRRNDLEKNS